MEVVVFTTGENPGLVEALTGEGLSARTEAIPSAEGPGESRELVAGLRGAEAALESDPPDVVLVTGAGDGALATALTAVKLQIPTGWLGGGDDGEGELIARVADASLDASAPAGDLASRVRDLAARTLRAP
jgi:UDP-N-acetylglucosamine 2-epimerase